MVRPIYTAMRGKFTRIWFLLFNKTNVYHKRKSNVIQVTISNCNISTVIYIYRFGERQYVSQNIIQYKTLVSC